MAFRNMDTSQWYRLFMGILIQYAVMMLLVILFYEPYPDLLELIIDKEDLAKRVS